jgi:hypothetical protein
LTISIWKKLTFYILLLQKIECQLLDPVEQLSLFCPLLESSLARINRILAVDKFYVEQLISCQKCRANDCRAIKFWAVDPHSIIIDFIMFIAIYWNQVDCVFFVMEAEHITLLYYFCSFSSYWKSCILLFHKL